MSIVYVIAGPTASGKSALALEKAAALNGIIINADSMQVYDALPILTAQPSAADRALAPHDLYGFQPINEWYSAGHWRQQAIDAITRTLEEGKTPIVVGGSGLYLKSLMEGFSPMPDIPPDARQRAIDRQAALGNPAFHAELAARDPVMAARFHPYHTARLVRAYEVLEATGRSLAEFQAMPRILPPEDWEFDVSVVMPERRTLYARCDARFLWMLENGAVEEMKAFDAAARDGRVADNALIHKALGARPLRDWLNGRISRDEAIEQGQRETRQYAKRQMTWFRNQIKPQKNIARISRIG